MRPRLTALVIVGVLAVGVAAVFDSLRERETTATRRTTSDSRLGEAVAALRTAGVRGVLTYSDHDCRLHAVRLPTLTSVRAPAITSCEPHVPSGGIGTWKGDVVWSGFGFRTIQVVLPRKTIDRAVGRWLDAQGLSLRAVQAVSFGEERYALLLDDQAQAHYMAFFKAQRVLEIYPLSGEDYVLRRSPAGSYVALLTRGASVQLFTRAGQPQALPPVANPHAIAWSPDDAWTALATSRSVYVFRSGEDDNTLPRIPLAVRDLDWDT